MKAVDSFPIIGLAASRRFFGAQQVGNGGQPAVVSVLVDAQTVLCLGDGSPRNLYFLPCGVQVE